VIPYYFLIFIKAVGA